MNIRRLVLDAGALVLAGVVLSFVGKQLDVVG
jgi:hypothetical protein